LGQTLGQRRFFRNGRKSLSEDSSSDGELHCLFTEEREEIFVGLVATIASSILVDDQNRGGWVRTKSCEKSVNDKMALILSCTRGLFLPHGLT
jgi:hypothetical protein